MAIKIKKRYKKREFPKENINERIRVPKVLVILEDGTKLGEMDTRIAIEKAYEMNKDLILIAPTAKPPVAKIQEYGRYKYEKAKKLKAAKQNQIVILNKEIRLTATIGDHDLQVKIKKAREFLLDNNRVKVSLKFRGRMIQNQDVGKEIMEKFKEAISDVGLVDREPKLNGIFLDMYLVPKKK